MIQEREQSHLVLLALGVHRGCHWVGRHAEPLHARVIATRENNAAAEFQVIGCKRGDRRQEYRDAARQSNHLGVSQRRGSDGARGRRMRRQVAGDADGGFHFVSVASKNSIEAVLNHRLLGTVQIRVQLPTHGGRGRPPHPSEMHS